MPQPPAEGHKTMAIRLPHDVSAQLTLIAQLEGTSIAQLIRDAIDRLLAEKRDQDGLAAKAEAALAEIEAETAARRAAIEAMLNPKAAAAESPPRSPRGRGRRGSEEPE